MAFVYKAGEIEEIEVKYQAGTALDQLALEYDKSVASIRMKLVKRGSYVKKSDPKPAQVKQSEQTSTSSTTKQPTTPKPTTKAGILQATQHAMNLVGLAPF